MAGIEHLLFDWTPEEIQERKDRVNNKGKDAKKKKKRPNVVPMPNVADPEAIEKRKNRKRKVYVKHTVLNNNKGA